MNMQMKMNMEMKVTTMNIMEGEGRMEQTKRSKTQDLSLTFKNNPPLRRTCKSKKLKSKHSPQKLERKREWSKGRASYT